MKPSKQPYDAPKPAVQGRASEIGLIERLGPAAGDFTLEGLRRIGEFLTSYVAERRFPGFCVLVARGGRPAYSGLAGWRDPAALAPMTEDTIFRVYSMTKPVVCTAFMTLYDEGRVRLEDEVSRFLPAFSRLKVLTGKTLADSRMTDAERPLLIQDLLTHTSGLTYGFLSDSPVSILYREAELLTDADRSLGDLTEELARLPLAFQPGKRWHYSHSIDVIAALVEVLSGKPLRDFLAERLLRPLGMEDTGFKVPLEKRGRIAAMYGNPDIARIPLKQSFRAWRNGFYERIDVESTYPSDNDGGFARGGHGLFSTAADFFRFAQALLNRGELDGVRVLKPGTVDLMHANRLPDALLPFDLGGLSAPGYGFGLGSQVLLDVEASGLPGSAGEYGWGGAAKTFYWVDPRKELVALIFTQYMASFDTPELEFKRRVYQALAV